MTGQGTPADRALPTSTGEPARPQVEAGSPVEEVSAAVGQTVPAPEGLPKAPTGDLATIRVDARRDTTGAVYFRGRAYANGITIGEVKATSPESALAGATESIASKWRDEATGVVPSRGEGTPDKPQDSGSGR